MAKQRKKSEPAVIHKSWKNAYLADGRHMSELSVDELDELIEKVAAWRAADVVLEKQFTILDNAVKQTKKEDEEYHLTIVDSFQEYLKTMVGRLIPFLSYSNLGWLAKKVEQRRNEISRNQEVFKIQTLN